VAQAAPAADAQSDAGQAARCKLVTNGAPADLPFGEGAELGEAVVLGDAIAVGVLRAHQSGRLASVVRLEASAAAAVDLGLSWGDAPPPQPLVRGTELYAVAYVRPDAKAPAPGANGARRPERALSVHRVGPTVERLLQLPPETDGSSAYDVIGAATPGSPLGAIVAWDDDLQGPPCGRTGVGCWLNHRSGTIRLAALSPDLRALQALRTVRGATEDATDATDVGDPRLAARGAGYWLAWVARRPEHPVAPLPLPAGEVETPSEEAAYGWVEAVALDPQGAPLGTPRRLTSATGHVGSYVVTSQGGALVVIAEDEGTASGRGGGSLERVSWRGDGSPEARVLVRSGVEEETPPAVIASASGEAWLSFLDLRGDTEVEPLDAPDSTPRPPPASPPLSSPEPLLDHGRLLAALGGRIALATTDGTRWTRRWATCAR